MQDNGRVGPRPLGLHLSQAMAAWLGGAAAVPAFLQGLIPWHPSLAEAAGELRAAAAAQPAAFTAATAAEGLSRMDAVAAGIRRYQLHPYRRDMPTPPELLRLGSTRLLDFGTRPRGRRPKAGRVILVVPSLVNPAYVLDLNEKRSFLRWLASRGWRPLLVDWGQPGPLEQAFTLADYVGVRLVEILNAAVAANGGAPVTLAGYCMGGTLALALACLRPEQVRALAVLASPWDFHAGLPAQSKTFVSHVRQMLAGEGRGEVPADLLQLFFATLDPALTERKFRRFAAMPEGDEVADFVALEDWVNDGMPMARPTLRDCLEQWYHHNLTNLGEWRVGGCLVRPQALAAPAFAAIPRADRIVPPASARAMADGFADGSVYLPSSGHVGMITGQMAPQELWRAFDEWLLARAI